MDTASLPEALLACETRVWEALVTGDAEADGAALSDDFLGVYPDGMAGKAAHVAQLAAGPTVARYRLSGARVLPIGADHALLAYHAAFTRVGAVEEEAMYVSSLWRRDEGGWINLFSQDTPATGARVP